MQKPDCPRCDTRARKGEKRTAAEMKLCESGFGENKEILSEFLKNRKNEDVLRLDKHMAMG